MQEDEQSAPLRAAVRHVCDPRLHDGCYLAVGALWHAYAHVCWHTYAHVCWHTYAHVCWHTQVGALWHAQLRGARRQSGIAGIAGI
jgi:hypothetical protein